MHRFRIVHAHDLIEMTVAGTLDVERSRALLLRLAEANAETGLDLLLDLRTADGTGITYREIYTLVELLQQHPDAFRGKLAVLDTDQVGFEKVQFFQASATERGFQVRAFLEFEAAARWLQQSSALDSSESYESTS